MAVMRCYRLSQDKVQHIQQREYLDRGIVNFSNKTLNNGFNSLDRMSLWKQIKMMLEIHKDCRKIDDMYYITYNNDNIKNDYICFAIGTGKQETLEKIYIQTKEREETKQEKEEIQKIQEEESIWDLSSDASLVEHLNKIKENVKTKNKLSVENENKLLYSLISQDVVQSIKNKDSKFIIKLVNNYATNKEYIKKYTSFNTIQIEKYLKQLNESRKQTNFFDKLMSLQLEEIQKLPIRNIN